MRYEIKDGMWIRCCEFIITEKGDFCPQKAAFRLYRQDYPQRGSIDTCDKHAADFKRMAKSLGFQRAVFEALHDDLRQLKLFGGT